MQPKLTAYLCILAACAPGCARHILHEKTSITPQAREASQLRPAISIEAAELQLTEFLQKVESWHSTNYSKTSWSVLISAAKFLQKVDPAVVVVSLRNYQENHRGGNEEDSKLFLLLRVAFDLPESGPLPAEVQPRFAVPPWFDLPRSNGNIATNAAWPVVWNNGGPKLISNFSLYQGSRYDASAEYDYMRLRYPFRKLN